MRIKRFIFSAVLLILFFIAAIRFQTAQENKEIPEISEPNGETAPASNEDSGARSLESRSAKNNRGAMEQKDAESAFAKKLKSLFREVSKYSLLDSRALQPFREKAKKMVQNNPDEFENFVVSLAQKSAEGPLQPLLFFIEVLVGHHGAPSRGIQRILSLQIPEGADSPGELSAHQKLDFVKGMVLGTLDERWDDGPAFHRDPKGPIRQDLVNLLKYSKNFELAYQAWDLLEERYNVDPGQLSQWVAHRQDRDQFR